MEVKSDADKLLKFFASYDVWEDENFLLKKASVLIEEELGLGQVMALTLPISGVEAKGVVSYRLKMGRDFLGQDKKAVEKLAIFARQSESEQTESAPEGTWVLRLGKLHGQIYLIVVKENKSPNRELLNTLVTFLRNSFAQVVRWKELERAGRLAHIDDVTGLFNQRKLNSDLDLAARHYGQSGEGFSVLFIDIDHFKLVNDGHGHLVGTHLLKAVGKTIRENVRDSDLIYRYGGDEFVLLLPATDAVDAKMIGQRILKSVKNQKYEVGPRGALSLSVSIGLANFPEDASSRDDILEIADRMMYEAKSSGRGRVCHAGEIVGNIREK